MATKVTYTDRSGKKCSLTLGSRSAAEAYARTVKGAVLEDVETAAPVVEVKQCPAGTAEAQKAATNAFYAPIHAARHGVIVREESDPSEAEHRAERMAEHFAESRAAGMPMDEAMRDWDFVQGRG